MAMEALGTFIPREAKLYPNDINHDMNSVELYTQTIGLPFKAAVLCDPLMTFQKLRRSQAIELIG